MIDQDAFGLGQTLIVVPDIGFASITAALAACGLTRTEPSPAATLIVGEPELASWSHGGAKPFVTYTLNPVAMLRVLDVATAPPALRAQIASRLPLLSDNAVTTLLDAVAPRDALRGLWAARETGRIDLIAQVRRVADTRNGMVAEQAAEVCVALEATASARQATLVLLRQVEEAAEAVIARLQDPAFARGLQPDRAACASLFDAELVEAAAVGAQRLFGAGFVMTDGPTEGPIRLTAAPAGLLRWPNERSRDFPRGYRTLAGWMDASRVWLTWTVDGTRYDGLAWLDGRFVWLPKPYRILRPMSKPG